MLLSQLLSLFFNGFFLTEVVKQSSRHLGYDSSPLLLRQAYQILLAKARDQEFCHMSAGGV